MSHVDPDELAGLALDPADGTPEARTHLATCADCAELLTALTDVRLLAGAEPLVAAPDRVRAAVLAEVRGEGIVQPVPLPARPAPGERRPGRRVPAWVAGIAAAVALVAGLGLGRLTVADPEPPEEGGAPTVVAAADLTALDSDAPRGEASAVRTDDTITLRVRASELGDEDGFHEVWLINLDGTRMVALGVLAEGDEGEFQVPRGLIDEGYRIVDISVEPDDGDPTHSGVSLARGELA